MAESDDLRDICISCAEMQGGRELNILWNLLGEEIGSTYLLHESENFVVVPGAGAIVPGYTLIIPREHILSLGFLPHSLDDEFSHVLSGVKRWLSDSFGGEPHVFEHGAKNFREKGGACADHAHVQVVPVDPSTRYIDALRRDFRTLPADSYLDAARALVAAGEGDPYLYTSSDSHGGAIAVATGAKSQYFRRELAAAAGVPDDWDGVLFPFVDNMRLTLDAGARLPSFV